MPTPRRPRTALLAWAADSVTSTCDSTTIAALFRDGRRTKRIGLDERLRRHHAALRLRRVLIVVVLGAVVIGLSLLLGKVSGRYDPIPDVSNGK